MTPRASIVVPVLRQRDDWLLQALNSVLGQSVASELIVVISPNTPDSNRQTIEDACVDSPLAKIVMHPRGTRFAGAINHGFACATADRVGLLLSDDWLSSRAIECCLTHKSDIVSTGRTTYLEDGSTVLLSEFGNAHYFARLADNRSRASHLSHFFLFSKQAFEEVGGVDERIGVTGADDYDLVWSMLDNGSSVTVVEDRLYKYRDHSEERLTLKAPEIQIRSIGIILSKHQVEGCERQRLLESHSKWFGKSLRDVISQQSPELFELKMDEEVLDTASQNYTYPQMHNGTGELQNQSVICQPDRHKPGHCLFGPGYLAPAPGRIKLVFQLEFKAENSSQIRQATLDVYNQTQDRIEIIRDLTTLNVSESVRTLQFSPQAGQRYEFRVYWHGLTEMICQGVLLEAHFEQPQDTAGSNKELQPDSGETMRLPGYGWCFRESVNSDFAGVPVKMGERFDHYYLVLDKRYPDAYLDLEKMGLTSTAVASVAYAQLNIYSATPDVLPADIYKDRSVNWHQQAMELPGLIASAGLHFPDRDRIVIQLIQSDLMQRYGAISEYRGLRRTLESHFNSWYKLLLNAILDYACLNQFQKVYCPTSETAKARINKKTDSRLLERIYDYPARNYNTRRIHSNDRDYWELDLGLNHSRIGALTSRQSSWTFPKTICLLHDIEENVDTDVSVEECRLNLGKMLEIEKRHDVRSTYNILGKIFDRTSAEVLRFDDHALGFHSYDHRRDSLTQLPNVREVNWKVRGYRPPGSVITSELSSLNLARYNFEWLASSQHSFRFDTVRIQGGVVKIPIHMDDHLLYTGLHSLDEWFDRVIHQAESRNIFTFSVHDCYAGHWLEAYDDLLGQLTSMARFVDCDQLAGETFRSIGSYDVPSALTGV